MDDERTIFAEALAHSSPQERAAYLDAACAGNPQLRARVEALLAGHARARRFLEAPPPGVTLAAESIAAGAGLPVERAGATVGPYKLLEPIGEGGMGVVFLAEQFRPVRRKVALKIIKPGLDTRQVIARFDAERQALAMMDHPGIARVLDAGATEAGRPYFVMELVKGTPITDYCDQHQLSPRQRLALFVQVCQAVQHAHTKGIIHRDLKPSNVLVCVADDGHPVPKVIDFGIAKATAGAQPLTEQTFFTEFRQLLGTPLYMSPEQAQASAVQDVDTRSDIYSLGVLLYELLTGTTPFDKQRLAKAAYDEVRRIIREEEPPRPSTRLSALGQSLTTVSAQRHTDPKKLGSILRGDLDWIVMKALEKDRSRRYETANGLARDVDRYLADQPVEACPPSRFYLLHKYVRRHRRALMATGIAAAVLLAATFVSTWEAVRATRARDAEAAQRRQAEAVADLLESVFKGLDPAEYNGSRDFKTRLVSRLDGVAAGLEAGYAGEPLVRARLRRALGETHLGLGDPRKAEALFRSAQEEQRRYAGPDAEETLVTMDELGSAYRAEGRFDEAIRLMEQVRDRRINTRGPLDATSLRVMNDLATAYFSAGRVNDSISLLERVRSGETRTLGADDPDTLRTTSNLAGGYLAAGRFHDAIKLLEPVRDQQVKQLGPDHPDTLSTLHNLVTAYISAGRLQEALALAEQVRDDDLRRLGPDHPDTLMTAVNLAKAMLASAGRVRDAIQLLEQVRDRQIKVLGADHPDALRATTALAGAYRMAGRYGEAIKLLEQVRDQQVKELGTDHRDALDTMALLAAAYGSAGRNRDQIRLLMEVRDREMEALGSDHPDTLATMDGLADAYRAAGRIDESIKLLEVVRDRKGKALGPDHPQTLRTVTALAGAYGEAGRFGLAIKLLEGVRDRWAKMLGASHPAILEAMSDLAVAYREAGKTREAIALLEQVRDQIVRQPGLGDPNDLVTVEQELAGAYGEAGRINDSIRLLEYVRDQRRKMLGDDHPLTLTSMNCLADACLSAGRTGEAIALLEKVRNQQAKTLAPDHPDFLTTEDNLSEAYEHAGRLDEAIELRKQVLAREVKKLGADHPDTLITKSNLAEAYRSAGRKGEAIKLLEQVRDGQIKTLGADHPDLLTILNNLGLAYWSAGRNNDAINLLEHVRDRRIKESGLTHPNTLTTLNNLALAYQSAGRLDEAIRMFEQARDLRIKVSGPDHPDTLVLLTNLCNAYRAAGRVEEAVKRLEQVREREIKTLGPNHPQTLSTMQNLGVAYRAAGRLNKAIDAFEEVRARRIKALGPRHRATRQTSGSLADAYRRAGRYADAEPVLIEICRQDPNDQSSMRDLIRCYRKLNQPQKAQEWEHRLHAGVAEQIQKDLATTLPTDPRQAGGQLWSRAKRHAQLGEFAKAAAELSESLRIHGSQGARTLLACTQLYLEDEKGYLLIRPSLVRKNTSGSGPATMLLVGETGLMGPATAEQINMAALWIDQAAAPSTRPASAPSTAPTTAPATRPAGGISPPAPEAEVQLARGMLAYRRANFESAIEYLRRGRAALEKAQASADSNEVERLAEQHATAGFFLAMAEHQLTRTPEARQALAQARQELETDVPSPFSADPQVGTPEWLIAHIAARRAAALIDPTSPTTRPTTSRASQSH